MSNPEWTKPEWAALETDPTPKAQPAQEPSAEPVCTCGLVTRLAREFLLKPARTDAVGDGCEVCNPALALEYAKETITDLRAEVERERKLRRELQAALEALRLACSLVPAMNHRDYDPLGARVNKALARAEQHERETGKEESING